MLSYKTIQIKTHVFDSTSRTLYSKKLLQRSKISATSYVRSPSIGLAKGTTSPVPDAIFNKLQTADGWGIPISFASHQSSHQVRSISIQSTTKEAGHNVVSMSPSYVLCHPFTSRSSCSCMFTHSFQGKSPSVTFVHTRYATFAASPSKLLRINGLTISLAILFTSSSLFSNFFKLSRE